MWEGGSNAAYVPGVYGKRVRESREGGSPTPDSPPPMETMSSNNDFVYSAFGSRDFSSLLFLRVRVADCEIRALVDSGSSRTFLGEEAGELIKRTGFRFRAATGRRVTTATNQTTRVRGETEIPISVQHRTRTLKVYSLPTLALSCILGMDFLAAFGVVVDFGRKAWCFADDPLRQYPFEEEPADTLANLLSVSAAGDAATRDGVGPRGDAGDPPREGERGGSEKTPSPGSGLSELSSTEQNQLSEFLSAEITGDPERPGTTNLTEHRIDVGGHAPIKQRYYPVSPKIQEAIYAEVNKMLEADIIEPSRSEWSTPIVMVKKPNGTYRFCLDFRKLNNVSKKDAYPLPYMNAILDKLRSARYISTIDLSQAYFQIPLEKTSRELTAFTVPGKGLFHFKRMPYGLTGAPATFQRLLDRLIGPEMEPHAFAYLDDIVVVTQTFDEHLEWLKRVLDRIREAGLTINPEKSKFCRSQVKYLGFLVQKEGLTVDPDKTAAILNYPPPRNLRQLRRFIGMASWYRRFIPQCATRLEPMTRLLKKNHSWEWGDAQKQAFEAVKFCLITPPTLSCPDFRVPFILQTDASSVGLGAVLAQKVEETEHVIAFASRALSDAEKKYSTTEQECLAVVWAIKKFRPYLEGYRFTVITDHSSLRWLHNLKNPTGRLARWALELLEYDYVIEHRKGAMHHVPDALSRIYETDGDLCAVVATRDEWYNERRRRILEKPGRYPGWRVMDERLYFRRPHPVVSQVIEDRDRWKLVVPRESRGEVMRENHDPPHAGHLGVEKTYQRIAVRYYWPRMFKDVANYVRRCDTCQRTKVEQDVPVGLMGRRAIEAPWVVVAADVMGPFPPSKTGHAYLLVLQDLFTKWVECSPLRKATGKKIREAIEDLVILRWGAPRVLLTDNGTEFLNREIGALAEQYGFLHSTVPPYHPQANPVERVNRVLKTMITAFLERDHREWDRYINEFRFAYNSAHHTSLQATPAFLNFGREPQPVQLPRGRDADAAAIGGDDPEKWRERMERIQLLREWVVENLEAAQERQAEYYNRHRRERHLAIGDQVLKRQHVLSSAAQRISAKLSTKFHGPFVVQKALSPVVYELGDMAGNTVGKVHVKDLKPYYRPLDCLGVVVQRDSPRPGKMSDEFTTRWSHLFYHVAVDYPGFWEELEDEIQRRQQERRMRGRGAVVREWPRTEDRAVQTSPRWVAIPAPPIRRDVQVQMSPSRGDFAAQIAPTTREVGVQAEPAHPTSPVSSEESGPEDMLRWVRPSLDAPGLRRGPVSWADRRDPIQPDFHAQLRAIRENARETCWNCGSEEHFVSRCPEPRRRDFCYRCGRRGTTVRDCPSCREGWAAQGPYVPGRGHLGPSPPRRAGGPPGTRRGPY